MIPIGAFIGVGASMFGRSKRKKTEAGVTNLLTRTFLAGPLFALWVNIPFAKPVFGCAILLAAFPALTLRFILLPLRLPRVAYYFALLSPPISTSSEIKGAAALFGSLAALRRRMPDPATVAFLQRRLTKLHTLRAAGLAANGFVALLQRRREHARLLLEAADSVPTALLPRLVRRPVQAWLVADAAERGDFRYVNAVAGRGWQRWPRTVALIGRCLLGEPDAPSNAVLWLAWAAAPHRLATLPMLRRALATPRVRGAAAPEARPATGGAHPLDAAIAAHAALARTPSPATVTAAVFAWDEARATPATCPLLARRALALETSADAALARLFEAAESDLAVYAYLAPDGTRSATLDAAAGQRRRADLEAIETSAAALRDRTRRAALLAPAEEWTEWTSLRAACERARGDGTNEERCRTVFHAVYDAASGHAVWLFNAQSQKLLANVIFRWLAEEGRNVANDATRALLKKNIACGAG